MQPHLHPPPPAQLVRYLSFFPQQNEGMDNLTVFFATRLKRADDNGVW